MPAYYRYHAGLDWRAAEIDLGPETIAYLHKNKGFDESWGFEIVSSSYHGESPWPDSHETSSYAEAYRTLEKLLVGRTESDHSIFGKVERGPSEGRRSLMFCGLVSHHLPEFINPIIDHFQHFTVLNVYPESTVALDLHAAQNVRDILHSRCTPELQTESFEPKEFKPDFRPVAPAKRQKRPGSVTQSQGISVQKGSSGTSLWLAFVALVLLIIAIIMIGIVLKSNHLI